MEATERCRRQLCGRLPGCVACATGAKCEPTNCERRHSGTPPEWGTFPLRDAVIHAAPAREPFMPIFANLLAAPCIVALLCLAGSPLVLAQQKPADQPAARQPGAKPPTPAPAGKAPIDKFSVVSQAWHRFPGLA